MIKARMIIEVLGWPKKAIREALEKVVGMMDEREHIKVTKSDYGRSKRMGQKAWASFVEVEGEFNELNDLVGAIIDFGPLSVEILEPDKINLDLSELQNVITDFVYKVKQINETMRNLVTDNLIMKNELEGRHI